MDNCCASSSSNVMRRHAGLYTPAAAAVGAGSAATEPVRIPNLISTVLHTVFDVAQLRLLPGVPRELTQQLVSAPPISGLMPT